MKSVSVAQPESVSVAQPESVSVAQPAGCGDSLASDVTKRTSASLGNTKRKTNTPRCFNQLRMRHNANEKASRSNELISLKNQVQTLKRENKRLKLQISKSSGSESERLRYQNKSLSEQLASLTKENNTLRLLSDIHKHCVHDAIRTGIPSSECVFKSS